jgi:hypothetical protein
LRVTIDAGLRVTIDAGLRVSIDAGAGAPPPLFYFLLARSAYFLLAPALGRSLALSCYKNIENIWQFSCILYFLSLSLRKFS